MSETDGPGIKVTVDPARAVILASQIQNVRDRIEAMANNRNVRLVAVSKLKPANDILALHEGPIGQEHFGENYAQELSKKADLLPKTIKWHFIGGLQSGHCKSLAKIPNLFAVSSVGSVKHARLLEQARSELRRDNLAVEPLGIHVQVNTSGEVTKAGITPPLASSAGENGGKIAEKDEILETCRFVRDECPNLHLLGLMTIGAIARSVSAGKGEENEDFITLAIERDRVQKALRIPKGDELELSMGMSEDFEQAIKLGSSEVRVGSTIFGARPLKKEAKLVD